MCRRLLYVFLISIVLMACSDPTIQDIQGQYRGVLHSPGGELAFPIHLSAGGDSLAGYIVNGIDTTAFNIAELKGDSLILGFDYYDSYLRAKVDYDGSLSGTWYRLAEGGIYNTMEFTARKGIDYRYQSSLQQHYPFDGEWQVTFTEEDGTFPAHGLFVSEPGGKLHGTFQTETGDYRFLDGFYRDSSLTLSTFDGPHAYLFKGKMQTDGTIQGDFWSKNTYHATWTAHKGNNRLRNPLQTTAGQAVGNNVAFSFPAINGDTVSVSDPQFNNKPLVVYLFGSWCPNCADEAQMMKKVYSKNYSDTDLKILGLAFEYTGSFKKSAQMVRRYKQRFDIPWNLLIAGTSDKDQAAQKLPFLKQILSFPTSIFINRNHTISAVHVGFNGPATGSAYYKEIQRFKEHINEILR